MPVVAKKGLKGRLALSEAMEIAMAHADVFVRAGRARKEAQLDYELAKCGLLDYLGDEQSKVLPDGRTVTRSDASFPEAHIDRKAYVATTVTVGAPPAPAA